MTTWQLYHQLKEQVKIFGYQNSDFEILFEEMENDIFRYNRALYEFDDPNLNNFIDQYPKPSGNNPPKGSFYVLMTVMPKPKPILILEKAIIRTNNQGFGIDNSEATKRKFVGSVWFDTEIEADNFIMAVKLTFSGQYEVRQ